MWIVISKSGIAPKLSGIPNLAFNGNNDSNNESKSESFETVLEFLESFYGMNVDMSGF